MDFNICISSIGWTWCWSIDRRLSETNSCCLEERCARRRAIFAARAISLSQRTTGEANFELMRRIRRYNRTAEVIECAHKPLYLQNVFTGERLPLEALRDTFIGSLCAIAAPESFEDALTKLGAHVDLAKRYIDHHYYTEAELISFINRCIRATWR